MERQGLQKLLGLFYPLVLNVLKSRCNSTFKCDSITLQELSFQNWVFHLNNPHFSKWWVAYSMMCVFTVLYMPSLSMKYSKIDNNGSLWVGGRISYRVPTILFIYVFIIFYQRSRTLMAFLPDKNLFYFLIKIVYAFKVSKVYMMIWYAYLQWNDYYSQVN